MIGDDGQRAARGQRRDDLPEQLVWYIIMALLPVGMVAGWRRDPLVTCLLALYSVPTAIALALTNGNVGTLLRLREMTVTPYIVWVSAVGFAAFLQWQGRRTGS